MQYFSFLHQHVDRTAEEYFLKLIGEYCGMEIKEGKYRILFFPLLKDGSLGQIKVESKGYHICKPGTGDSVLLSPLTIDHWRKMFDYRAPKWIYQIRGILLNVEDQTDIADDIRAIDDNLENIRTIISNQTEPVDLRLYARRWAF
jgi:hypothetical protein